MTPKGMFQTPGPYVRMNFSPLTPLCPDFGSEIRLAHERPDSGTYIQIKKFLPFPKMLRKAVFVYI
jgi:hypothetical protein